MKLYEYILFFKIIIIFFKKVLGSEIQELFTYIYPKLDHLSSGKSVNFCNNYECTFNYNISEELKLIFNDGYKKYFCMVNNSLYILKNNNESIFISSYFPVKLENNTIKRYNIIPYYFGQNTINYIINFIYNNQKIVIYQYRINITNIRNASYLYADLIQYNEINNNKLSNDINCQIIGSELNKLICFYYNHSDQINLGTIYFDLENISKIEIKEFTKIDTANSGAKESTIKSCILNEEEIFIFMISNAQAYNFILNHKFNNISKTIHYVFNKNKYHKNEVEVYYFQNTKEIVYCYNDSSYNIFFYFFGRNDFGSHDNSDIFDNKFNCLTKYIFYYFDNNTYGELKYKLTEECFEEKMCKTYSNFIIQDYPTVYTQVPTSLLSTYINIDSSNEISDKILEEEKEEHIINLIKNETKLNITKEQLIKNITNIINEVEIGKTYEIEGEDFILSIYPTNSTFPPSSTHVNFSECESIIRSHYNISSSSIITFFQLEINNDNSHSLINKVEYQAYNNEKVVLDLSICDNAEIQVIYAYPH